MVHHDDGACACDDERVSALDDPSPGAVWGGEWRGVGGAAEGD